MLTLIAALFALSLAACNSGTKPAPGGEPSDKVSEAGETVQVNTDKDTLHLTIAGDPETLDVGKMSGAPEGRIAFNCFEGLWMPAAASGPPVYAAAESHTVSEDGHVWTMKLRKDAKWSNGDPVTAHDFAYAWKRVLTPGFDADYAEMLDVLKGAEAFRKGETDKWEDVGVKALDDHTLEVTLKNPTPYLAELFAFYTFFPVHKASVEKFGEHWTQVGNYITNGPYKLTAFEHQQFMLLETNEHYWGAKDLKIAKIKLHIIKDNSAQLNAFKSGQIDVMAGGIPIGKIPALKGMKEFRIDPLLGTYYYKVNVKGNEALAKPLVRKALALSVDRKAITQRTMKGLPAPAEGFVPPMDGYTQTTRLTFDPDKARELLKEAGYPNGEGFPETTLLFNTDENHKLLAEILQDMWGRELNIKLKLENMEWKTYLDAVDKGNYQIARAGWIGDYSDPETFLIIMMTGNGNNDTGWGSEAYDKLIKDAQAEVDPAKRIAMLAKAEELVMEEMPIIPIYTYRNPMLISSRVVGLEPHNRDVHLVKYLSLK